MCELILFAPNIPVQTDICISNTMPFILGYTINQGPLFYEHRFTLIPAWRSNYIHYEVCDEIIYPFPNLNGTISSHFLLELWLLIHGGIEVNIEGILPKWPYPPCLRMADRAFLSGYSRYIYIYICVYLWRFYTPWRWCDVTVTWQANVHSLCELPRVKGVGVITNTGLIKQRSIIYWISWCSD